MEKVKGVATCKVCGRDFPLIMGEHYIAHEPKHEGSIYSLVSTDKASEFDAFDCPHCGCQNVMQERKPSCPCDYGYCGDCEEESEEQEDKDNDE